MRRSRVVVPLVLVAAAAAGGCTDDDEPGPTRPTPTVTDVSLTFGVWGTEPEVAAYQNVVDGYNAADTGATVTITPFADREALLTAVETGPAPDVFLVNRQDLGRLRDADLNRPLGTLLDDREVDFGDGYFRVALEAFSAERDLQCMPYGISPMVIYYNKDLVDFEAMAERELDVPTIDDEDLTKRPAWSIEQFQAAAEFASRPRRGEAGFYVAPTLRGLSPFIYSGGGEIYNDDEEPTSLAFSSDDTRSALEKVLPLLRDPKLGLTTEQLAEKAPLEWFREGKLGMIAGHRDLVPQLRTSVVDFDLMPMPTVDGAATIGDIVGVCIAQDTEHVADAADFLVDFVSTESVSAVAVAGYLAPANTAVALSEAFLQPRKRPIHAGVSNNSIRYLRIPPLIDDEAALDAAVADPLKQLLEVEVPDLEALTLQIDEASQTVLAPPEDTESPTEESSE